MAKTKQGAKPKASAPIKPARRPTRRGKTKKPAQRSRFPRVMAASILWPLAVFSLLTAAALADTGYRCGELRLLLIGALVYPAVHLLFWRPYFLHVTAHEFTHALFAALCLGRVYSLQIDTEDSGQITMSRRNRLISLAPYFFPLWTMIIALLYPVLLEPFRPAAAIIAGFFLGGHWWLTFRDLRVNQPDIEQSGGRVLALPLAAILHSLILITLIFIFTRFTVNSGDLIMAAERVISFSGIN